MPFVLSRSRTYRPSLGSQYRLLWMFGSKRREVRRWEWEMRLPNPGWAPVSMQCADMGDVPLLKRCR